MGWKCAEDDISRWTAKRMKQVLVERGVDVKGMNATKMREELKK